MRAPRCTACTQGRIQRNGLAPDGRPNYTCGTCGQSHTNGKQGYPWDKLPASTKKVADA